MRNADVRNAGETCEKRVRNAGETRDGEEGSAPLPADLDGSGAAGGTGLVAAAVRTGAHAEVTEDVQLADLLGQSEVSSDDEQVDPVDRAHVCTHRLYTQTPSTGHTSVHIDCTHRPRPPGTRLYT